MNSTTMMLGGGGKATNDFIKNYIIKYFGNVYLNDLRDASKLKTNGNISFTTDSFVVKPEFFPGGDIGKLAVYGTCNDLAVSGAKPKYLSLSLIVSEGYSLENLDKILNSIKLAVDEIDVKIVCGDTKVVERSEEPSIFINTTGIGELVVDLNNYNNINIGDKVIITSDIARHGLTVLSERNELNVDTEIKSDCCNLYKIFEHVGYEGIKFARDATRGGVAAVLNEIKEHSNKGFLIEEDRVPVEEPVKYLCEFLGFDMLEIANEGVAVLICENDKAEEMVGKLKELEIAKNARVVGEVTDSKKVLLKNSYGGIRVVEMPDGNLLPRIC